MKSRPIRSNALNGVGREDGGSTAVSTCQTATRRRTPTMPNGSMCGICRRRVLRPVVKTSAVIGVASSSAILTGSATRRVPQGRLATSGSGSCRQTIGVEEIEPFVILLRLANEGLLVWAEVLALETLQERVGLGLVILHLVPDCCAPDDVVGGHGVLRNDAVGDIVVDDR